MVRSAVCSVHALGAQILPVTLRQHWRIVGTRGDFHWSGALVWRFSMAGARYNLSVLRAAYLSLR